MKATRVKIEEIKSNISSTASKKNAAFYLCRSLESGKLECRLFAGRGLDRERAAVFGDGGRSELAQRRVEFEQVGGGLGDCEWVVDGDHVKGGEIDASCAQGASQGEAPDAAEAVDEGARAAIGGVGHCFFRSVKKKMKKKSFVLFSSYFARHFSLLQQFSDCAFFLHKLSDPLSPRQFELLLLVELNWERKKRSQPTNYRKEKRKDVVFG